METKEKRRHSASRSGTAGTKEAAPRRKKAAMKSKKTEAPAKNAATAQKRNGSTPRKKRTTATPEVVYIPAKPFSRNRLILRLITIAAVVIAMTIGISIFFKVEHITVSGAEKYTEWDVREASGIRDGENLLAFGKAKACGRIRTALPYVDEVRIGIKLPNTVNIYIKELDVVYSIKAVDGTTWLVTCDGRIVEQTEGSAAARYTNVLGVQLENPQVGQQAVAFEPAKPEPDATEASTEPVQVITAQKRLETALAILRCLEAEGVIGTAASVDVTEMAALQLWYGTQYQVELGDDSRLAEKIHTMKAAIDQMGDYQSGILDVSFTIWPNEVGFSQFKN